MHLIDSFPELKLIYPVSAVEILILSKIPIKCHDNGD